MKFTALFQQFTKLLVLSVVAFMMSACGGGGGGGSSAGSGGATPKGTLWSISVTPAIPTIKVGATQQFKATGSYYDTSTGTSSSADITASVAWSTTASGVATINSAGLASGMANGTTTIAATSGSISSSTTLAVTMWTDRLFGAGLPGAIIWNGSKYIGSSYASADSRVWTATGGGSGNDLAWDGTTYVALSSSWFYTSTDGLAWSISSLPSSVFSNSFYAVTKSSSTWVAVGSTGSIVYSSDGKTWTAAPAITGTFGGLTSYSPALYSVAWTGTQFIAGGEMGALVSSPDGITWTILSSPTTSTINALGANNGLIVAATGGGLWTSADGASLAWTVRWNPMSFMASKVKYLGGKWIAVGFGQSATSPDGLTWTAGTSTAISSLTSVAYNGSEYIATGSDRNAIPAVYASSDGLSWSYREVLSTQSAAAINPASGRMVSVGLADTSRTSLDGITWDFGPLASNDYFMDVTWAPSANAFVALVQSGLSYYTAISADGKTWTPGSYSSSSYVPCGYVGSTIAASSTVLLNAGGSLSGPCIAVSANNGASWTAGTSPVPSGQSTTRSFWTGNQFVLLGSNGFIGTSPDGLNWTVQVSGTTATLRGGAVGASSLLIVVGDGGTILTSTDAGVTWNAQSSGTTYSLKRVVWTGTRFFVAGAAATLLQSTDGATWSSVVTPYSSWMSTFPYPTPPDLNDLVWSSVTNSLSIFGSSGLAATIP